MYERLKREQHIKTLFLKGKAFSVFPVRTIYKITEAESDTTSSPSDSPLTPHPINLLTSYPITPSPLQVGFSVPKKKFRSSVHRHRVRRQLFEAWRLHKTALTDAVPAGKSLHVFLVFTGTELPQYAAVEKAVATAIEKLRTIIATPA